MGVMNCTRKGCDNIMCQTYIPEIGYICGDCQREFAIIVGCEVLPESRLRTKLEIFLSKSKDHDHQKLSVEDFFNKYK